VIKEMATDLLAKIRSLPEFVDRTSFSLGGNAEDIKLITIPACILLLLGDHIYEEPYSSTGPSPREPGIVFGTQQMLATFSALVIVPYGSDDEIVNTQFPLLGTVASTVHGAQGPINHRWQYLGQTKRFVYPDRIGYEQRYTLEFSVTRA